MKTDPPNPIPDDKLNDLWREACRDDWHLRIVGSEVRGLIAEVQRLRAQTTPDSSLIAKLEAMPFFGLEGVTNDAGKMIPHLRREDVLAVARADQTPESDAVQVVAVAIEPLIAQAMPIHDWDANEIAKAAIQVMGVSGIRPTAVKSAEDATRKDAYSETPASHAQGEIRYTDLMVDAYRSVPETAPYTDVIKAIYKTLRPYLRSSDPTEYAGFDSLGPEGQGAYRIGYDRGLADATREPVMVSLEGFTRDMLDNMNRHDLEEEEAVKVTLDRHGVRYHEN